tara:strand:- start:8172 stop:8390 length:219 start_codon:yes stop_codon:yes gene_type:complete
MAKVDVHLGFTFRVGPLEQNQYGRVDLTVAQVDTDLPVEPQLEESEAIADVVWTFIKGKVDAQIEEMLDSGN